MVKYWVKLFYRSLKMMNSAQKIHITFELFFVHLKPFCRKPCYVRILFIKYLLLIIYKWMKIHFAANLSLRTYFAWVSELRINFVLSCSVKIQKCYLHVWHIYYSCSVHVWLAAFYKLIIEITGNYERIDKSNVYLIKFMLLT